MTTAEQVLLSTFGQGPPASFAWAPGRVNLIGEHIDYHGLPVLPMAIERRVTVAFRARTEGQVQAVSDGHPGVRKFALTQVNPLGPAGDWGNYVVAAIHAARTHWPLRYGIDATITSDLPEAAGLSSSSALLTAFLLAILRANGIWPTFDDIFSVLPHAEQLVGTRGGAMDHAAILASKAGCALLIGFDPFATAPIGIPQDWKFIVAHSLECAEKSGSVRSEYNNRRDAGASALAKLGQRSYFAAIDRPRAVSLSILSEGERAAFLHVTTECNRVRQAVKALHQADPARFGAILTESHASLRDQLRVSTPRLDRLIETALAAGALGARLTGAGFGGCAVIFCLDDQVARIQTDLIRNYYGTEQGFDAPNHLFLAEPSAGALSI